MSKICILLAKDYAVWTPFHCQCEESHDRIVKHIEISVSTETVERVVVASTDTDVMITVLCLFRSYQKSCLKEL